MRKLFKIGFIILMVGALAYAGSCVYANFIVPGQNADASTIKMPKVQTAQYSFVIKANGNTVLTSSYDTYGNVYVLHGYWELMFSLRYSGGGVQQVLDIADTTFIFSLL